MPVAMTSAFMPVACTGSSNGFVLAMLAFESSKLYARLIMTHSSERRRAEELAALDPLTGLANRRAFEEALDQEWLRMRRYRTPLCLLMLDVDEFKRFNDVYGHVAGDRCLQAIAQVLTNNARRSGQVAARYGGRRLAKSWHCWNLEDQRCGFRLLAIRPLNRPGGPPDYEKGDLKADKDAPINRVKNAHHFIVIDADDLDR
jgi:hypothetical protein